ncbi:interferon-inducible GTPase 5-like [Hemitrygon akajei]|uniref:interferon-inducible GTPase 5-like n=1 Tax=Hemitrygon akajei TaxID=2704970 RepID=UPI003BF9FD97
MEGSHSSEQVAETETPSFFTQEELCKLKSDFETGGVEKVKQLIEKKITDLDKIELNIAVTGESGAGKSTFINAMRGLRSTDPGAAEVGTTETTMEPTRYSHPTLPNVRYWDLPGMGTKQFTAAKYLTEMKFERYDFFIIVFAFRLKENDVKLAKVIKQLGKRFYFVRSKIDADLDSMRKEKKVINEEEELEKIRSDCLRRLAEAGFPDPTLFLISSLEPNHFDFIQLNEGLEGDLNNVKKRIFVLSLQNLSAEIVQRKYEILKKHIWMFATLSGGLGAVPVPGFSLVCDIGILIGAIVHFRKCLGLDDASLQRLAKRAGKPVEELRATVKAPLLGDITPDVIMSKQVAKTETPSFFTQEELNKLKSDFETGGLEKVKPLIEKKVTDLDKTELNIAVTGGSGTGKSTFINAMRGLRSTDPGAAKSGTIETTKEPAGYSHPTLPNVHYWDLPGMGSIPLTAAKYLKEMKFERFDFFIIISAVRFREIDVKLAKEIKRLGKQFYFVRSKIDADLYSMRKERGVINEEEELEKIRSNTVGNLAAAGFPDPTVFLISSLEPDHFDFIRLNEGLEGDLNNVKKRLFVLALPNLSVEIVQKKSEILKKLIWMFAVLSGGLGAVPVPGFSLACDTGILIGAIVYFRKCLGLDDASLQRLAKRAGKPVEELRATVKAPLLGEITIDVIVRLGWGVAVVTVSILELALDFVPVIGSIFGAVSSSVMTYKILSAALTDLTKNAERVVKVAFQTD